MKNKFKHTRKKLALIVALVGAVSLAGADPSITLDVRITTGSDCDNATTDTLIVASGTDVRFCNDVANVGSETYNTLSLNTNPFGLIFDNAPIPISPGQVNALIHTQNITSTIDYSANVQVPTTGYDQDLPDYDFVDISTTGTALNMADDDEVNFPMDFPFTLYGLTSEQITIGNNGAIRLGISDSIGAANTAIGNDMDNNLIAPFWDDIDDETGDVYHQTIGTAPNRVFIVQWHERPRFNDIGTSTFQVKLFETTNVIEFHYQDVQFENVNFDFGASATVGIGGDVRGDQFSFNTASLSDNFAISYTPVYAYALNNPTYDFVDISTTGTPLGLADDGETDVSMDFPFTLYGLTSQDMTIGNNGAIRLGVSGAQVFGSNLSIENDIANNLIAPFLDDIDNDTGDVYHETTGTSPDRVFIVQWHNRPHHPGPPSTPGTGSATFQIKLFETTNVIEFHYQDVQFEEVAFDFGASATVGIGGAVHGDQYSFNMPSIADEFAISYTPVYPYTQDDTIAFDFDDISGSGTALGLSDDGEADVSMDFPFTLYGLTSQDMTIGNNGAIRFGVSGAQISTGNSSIEINGSNNLIAPFWDDIDSDTGDVYHQTTGTSPNRVFIVQWHERPHFDNLNGSTGGIGSTTFQVKLFETTNVIEFHYQDVQFEEVAFDFGASATVGIGGIVHGDQYSFNTASLSDNFAIAYRPASIDSASNHAMIIVDDDLIFVNGFE